MLELLLIFISNSIRQPINFYFNLLSKFKLFIYPTFQMITKQHKDKYDKVKSNTIVFGSFGTFYFRI